jgi:serine/threonine protein kinase
VRVTVEIERADSEGIRTQTFDGYSTISMGRSNECDVVLDCPEASRIHARLTIDPTGSARLEHLGNQETRVQGESWTEGPLPQPANIEIGPYVLTVKLATIDSSADAVPRLIRRLSTDSMCESHLAELPGHGKIVVKHCHPDLDDPMFADMLEDEGQLLSNLSHPNVSTYLGMGEELILASGENEQIRHLRQDYFAGASLRSLLSGGLGPLPEAAAAHIGAQIAAGLAHLHAAKDRSGEPLEMIHRDINPKNILLRRDGVVSIGGFMIAKGRGRRATTDPGVIKGTFGFMAPEQLTGEAIDSRVDIFALGATLYELVAGKQAFPGETPFDILRRVQSAQVTPLGRAAPHVSADMEELVMRCLEHDRDKRYPRADIVAGRLKMLAKGGDQALLKVMHPA